ncbi:MAG TPA: phosphoribosylglycinamide formyltransferase [Thermoanaerobaculia bacterium]|nr:phosphoribosylglycinamide formyltransferase [Thermoanaerobaculia bacterium]
MRRRLAVLLSGRGSNFDAIRRAIETDALEAEIVAVISNRPDALGLERARDAGLPAFIVDHRRFPTREAHEEQLVRILDEVKPHFIVLAGYMRMLSPSFVARYPRRIVNIHPSLLPAFPGLGAQAQALAHGARVSGCTVHFVDETLDDGPIIEQRAVEVLEDDTEETLSARILEQEHRAYVAALARLCEGNYRVDGRRVIFGKGPRT